MSRLDNRLRFQIEKTGLAKWIIGVCKKNKIKFVTLLQQICIPSILSKKDSIICSKIGIDKILTFVLTSLHLIEMNDKFFKIIILSLSKESGLQIKTVFDKLGKIKQISSYLILKPDFFKKIILSLNVTQYKKLIILTPNCVKSSLIQKNIKIDMIVFEDFGLTIQYYSVACVKNLICLFHFNRILIFINLLSKRIKFLKKLCCLKSAFYFLKNENTDLKVRNIIHMYLFCPFSLKINCILILLKFGYNFSFEKKNKHNSLIIFVSSRKICEKLFSHFKRILKVGKLCRGMNFFTKLLTLQMLECKKITALICSDSENIKLNLLVSNCIINYDFPVDLRTYLHRIDKYVQCKNNSFFINLISKMEIFRFYFLKKKFNTKFKRICLNWKRFRLYVKDSCLFNKHF
ncbi:transcription factor protein (nucleomorph) [Cryptomonas paramecium]|uniref:ATP-dependent RNA helicase n=1 Tax=Cryptomonas paramaecium TaxID=2898 RepID=F2HHY3_9CRYP|nr:transcription factor protein [Cryptomonas paramecium]AEA38929.1 transcription factor protein [Cryptomonas paramecium]|mmetsp:Transcript_59201/g.157209  ORF Transcript_59201/g.157209 Transcript_59201/m.157209 type:complete len:404 (+) Transcript_59201:3630-4841(+)